MQLEEFFDYKNQLMEDLLTNPRIVQLLCDNDIIPEHPEKLVYEQVYPYEYIPDTVEHGQTFICCDVDIQRSINKTYLLPVLYIWVFSHKSKLRLPEGGVRTDKLASEIAKTIDKKPLAMSYYPQLRALFIIWIFCCTAACQSFCNPKTTGLQE